MEKRAFNRNKVHHMQAYYGGTKPAGKVKGIGLSVSRVLGGIDADQDVLDHGGRPAIDRDIMRRLLLTRE